MLRRSPAKDAGTAALEIDAALGVANVAVVPGGGLHGHPLQGVALEREVRVGGGLRQVLELAQAGILAQMLWSRRRQIDGSMQNGTTTAARGVGLLLGNSCSTAAAAAATSVALEQADLLLNARRDGIVVPTARR